MRAWVSSRKSMIGFPRLMETSVFRAGTIVQYDVSCRTRRLRTTHKETLLPQAIHGAIVRRRWCIVVQHARRSAAKAGHRR